MKFNHRTIKQFRQERGLSQRKLLVETYKEYGFDISNVTLQNWEKGETIPRADDLAILAMFFNKPVKAFL